MIRRDHSRTVRRTADGGRPAPTRGPNEEAAEGGFKMKLPHRRHVLHLAAGAAALPAVARIAWAQTYPTRPVHLIVGAPPGGAADIVARLMSQWLSKRFGRPFVIDNRPGATTNIGTEA